MRENNEDVCLVDNDAQYYLVADGIGGRAAGEVASRLFLDTVKITFSSISPPDRAKIEDIIKQSFISAHDKLQQFVDLHPDHKGMGCTAEVLAFQDENAVVGHIGDSRSYLFRAGNLLLLTDDHTLVHEQVKAGLIQPEEARTHRLRNVILKAVGVEDDEGADIVTCNTQAGDIFLLCTDGLTDMLEEDHISKVLSGPESIRDKVDLLVALANKAGGKDNIAVVLVELQE